MNTPTYEAKILDTIEKRRLAAQLDRSCKAIVASRQVLAHILQAVIPEYKGCTIEQILPLIGTVAISEEAVNRDDSSKELSEKIVGEGIEDSSLTDGTRYYDMKFSAVTPNNDTIGLIINIEIQNDFNVEYPLIKRGIYYASRMISAQYGTVFKNSEYDKIQKVYSVWICTTPDVRHRNTISQYEFTRKNILGGLADTQRERQDYDLISVITICLGESATKECNGIIRFLNTLLAKNIPAAEKKQIMEVEYDMPMSREFNEEVDTMCNISSLYWEGGLAEGMSKGLAEGMSKGLAEGMSKGLAEGLSKGEINATNRMIINLFKNSVPIEVIADAARLSVPETEKIIREHTGE